MWGVCQACEWEKKFNQITFIYIKKQGFGLVCVLYSSASKMLWH